MENNIIFHITEDQAQKIAKHFNVDYLSLEEYDICTLLNRLIDELD